MITNIILHTCNCVKEELGEENVAYQVDFKQKLGADVNVKNTTHHLNNA